MSFSDEVERRAREADADRSRVDAQAVAASERGKRELENIKQEAREASMLLTRHGVPTLPLLLDPPPAPVRRFQRHPPRFTVSGKGWWLGDDVALTTTGNLLGATRRTVRLHEPTSRSRGNADVIAELRKVGLTSGDYLNTGRGGQPPPIRFDPPINRSDNAGPAVWLQLPSGGRDHSTEFAPLRDWLVSAVARLLAR